MYLKSRETNLVFSFMNYVHDIVRVTINCEMSFLLNEKTEQLWFCTLKPGQRTDTFGHHNFTKFQVLKFSVATMSKLCVAL